MTTRDITLREAQEQFRAQPTPATAGLYLDTLMVCEADGVIGDEVWLNGLAEVRDALKKMGRK